MWRPMDFSSLKLVMFVMVCSYVDRADTRIMSVGRIIAGMLSNDNHRQWIYIWQISAMHMVTILHTTTDHRSIQ